jgi:polar amino acid transport system substrate-binding protein
MKHLSGRLLPPLLALAVLVGWAGCAENKPAVAPAPAPKPALRVGITSTYPPVIFRQQGQVVGIEAELAALLGTRLGRAVQFVEVEWTGQIDALLADRTDIIMSGMSITDARRLRVAFSEPYLEGGLMALVRTEDLPRYETPEALLAASATVGVIEGTTGAVFAERSFPNARRVELSRASDGAQALRLRSIDIFVHDAPAIAWLLAANEAGVKLIRGYLNREQFAWAVRPTDTALLADVNAALVAWKADGTLAGLLARWLPYLRAN